MRALNEGCQVILNGWVDSIRDHGKLIFIDLRDRYGKTQLVIKQEESKAYSLVRQLGSEFVISAKGIVRKRTDQTINQTIPTGEIELDVDEIHIINKSNHIPFNIASSTEVSQDLRFKYRYLDLRNETLQRIFYTRHKIVTLIHQYFDSHGFMEIETPYMIKHTPGGARNFLIPSRLFPGQFFALAESPQIFKQLFMVAGFDKYYQIVRCFRDEDPRADRQPEFTQLDVEMSFIDQTDIFKVIEGCTKLLFEEILKVKFSPPFPKIPHEQAVLEYGTDKPDIRFEMKIIDVTEIVRGSAFKIVEETLTRGGVARVIKVSDGAQKITRKLEDELVKVVQPYGAKGILTIRVEAGNLTGTISKFLTDKQKEGLKQKLNLINGDLIVMIVDKPEITAISMGALRNHLGSLTGLAKEGDFKACWVVDFPMFELTQDGEIQARHHPFTSPRDEDLESLEERPLDIKAKAYDLVINGIEIGGGSIRIYDRSIQQRVFKLVGLSGELAREKFGFLLDAFEYGPPPHGGIALGFDRLVMLMLGLDSIREVMAFPKTQSAQCLLTGAPSSVDDNLLKDLHIRCV